MNVGPISPRPLRMLPPSITVMAGNLRFQKESASPPPDVEPRLPSPTLRERYRMAYYEAMTLDWLAKPPKAIRGLIEAKSKPIRWFGQGILTLYGLFKGIGRDLAFLVALVGMVVQHQTGGESDPSKTDKPVTAP